MTNESENDLIAKAAAGDVAAFEQVFMRYMPMLLAYCQAICGDYHSAQDALQETALVAFKNMNRFFLDADFSVWLRAVARRRALAARRLASKHAIFDEATIDVAYQDSDPLDLEQQREALGQCLGTLTGRMSKLIRGRYFEGLDLIDIAKASGMSITAAKQLLYRARLALGACIINRLRQGDSP